MTRDIHRLIFVAVNGLGPWPCHGCGKPVAIEAFVVHHLDDDHTNNDPENLAAMHRPCHIRHHRTGTKKSAEHRRKMGEARRGKPLTEEHRRKVGDALRKPWSAARRAAHDRRNHVG